MIVTGSRAPAFSLRSGAYSETTLLDYVGTTLVLVFYVADWHPVCSEQLRRYSELLPELRRLGAELLAISPDTLWSHAAFAAANRLSFPLLADDRPRGKIAAEYGVSDAQRALLVIDSSGMIAWSAAFPESIDPGVDGLLTTLERLSRRAKAHIPGDTTSSAPKTPQAVQPEARTRRARRRDALGATRQFPDRTG